MLPIEKDILTRRLKRESFSLQLESALCLRGRLSFPASETHFSMEANRRINLQGLMQAGQKSVRGQDLKEKEKD